MSALQVKNEIYEPKKLDAIYQNLVSNQQAGRNQDYEIKVDDFPVVGKNNDPTRFMSYADFITSDTKCITVFLYRSNGQSDKYFFHLKPEQFEKAEQLNGLNVQTRQVNETELRERLMKDLKYEELLKENATLKAEIAEYETIVQNMDKHIADVKSGRDKDLMGWVGLIGKSLLSNGIEKSANENVAGLDNQQENNSFKRKGVDDVEEEKDIIELSEKDRGYLLLLDDIRNRIGDVELANVMHLLDLVASNPLAIHYAIRHVTNFLNQHSKEKTDEKV